MPKTVKMTKTKVFQLSSLYWLSSFGPNDSNVFNRMSTQRLFWNPSRASHRKQFQTKIANKILGNIELDLSCTSIAHFREGYFITSKNVSMLFSLSLDRKRDSSKYFLL